MKHLITLSQAVFVAVVLAMAAVSCSKHQEVVDSPSGGRELSFTARMVAATKGTGDVSTSSLRTKGFGLFAWWENYGEYFEEVSPSRLWLENSAMSYVSTEADVDRWVCNPSAFWPLGNTKLSFFAYAPYLDCEGPELVFPYGDAGGMPKGLYSPSEDVSRQADLCLSVPVFDKGEDEGDIPMSFEHALTKVLFYFNVDGRQYEGDDYVYRVNRLELEGVVGSNVFTYSDSKPFIWNELPRSNTSIRTGSYDLHASSGTLIPGPVPFVSDVELEDGLDRFECVNGLAGGILYLLPQPMTSLAKITVTMAGGHYVNDEWSESFVMDPVEIELPTTTVWKAGETVAYSGTIDITRTIAVQLGVSIQAWDDETVDAGEFPVS